MERLLTISSHLRNSESALVSVIPREWDWDPKASKLNVEEAKRVFLSHKFLLEDHLLSILESNKEFQ